MASINLSTPVLIPKSEFLVSHTSSILLIGSCFTENIGGKLKSNNFNCITNPTGIIFNPISVVNSLKSVFNNQEYETKDLLEYKGKWVSFQHHGRFSAFNKRDSLIRINESIKKAHHHIKKSKTIFITLGTAWVYEYEDFGVVANCHKIPNKQFNKRLLSVKEILDAFTQIRADLKEFNVVFTVSPVRHVKDGLRENNLSKATLLLAINNLIDQNDNYHYFPAYEVVIDELRDYRFYKDDLVHPTSMAINYVWDKFRDCYFDDTTELLIVEIQKIKTAVNHKPFNFEGEEHQRFISKQLSLMKSLSEKYSFLDFKIEKEQLISSK